MSRIAIPFRVILNKAVFTYPMNKTAIMQVTSERDMKDWRHNQDIHPEPR